MSSPSNNPQLKSRDADPRPDAGEAARRAALVERFFSSRLRLSQLRVLATIAQMGQLKLAAEKLNVTPPAISKQIAEMEEALEARIVARVGRQVKFTPLGDRLAQRARDVLAQLDRTRLEVQDLVSGVSTHFGIGSVPTVAELFLPPLLSTLADKAPKVGMRVVEEHFAALAPLLHDGTLDLVIARETTHALSPAFNERQILSDPLVIACATKFQPRKRGVLHWQDLRGWPWLSPPRGSSTYVHLESLLFRHGLSLPAESFESNARSSVAALLQVRPLLALVPWSYAKPYLDRKLLVQLPLSTQGMMGTIKAVWRKDDDRLLVSTLVEAAARAARASAEAHPPGWDMDVDEEAVRRR